jgi:hypothetical protein
MGGILVRSGDREDEIDITGIVEGEEEGITVDNLVG